VGETIDYMRAAEDLPDDFYDLYIVDPKHHPVGFAPLSRVLRTRRPVLVSDIMDYDDDMRTVPVTMDQEEVAYTFRQYGLVSAPVVDEAGRLLGVITVDDVVHVIDEEAEEDIMKLGGVTEIDLYSATLDTTRARFPWLVVNLATAILASSVISLFEGAIDKLVALAVLMPIVASMGGNAGTQTLTVAVRAIAMKDLTAANALRFVGKELLVGSANGVLQPGARPGDRRSHDRHPDRGRPLGHLDPARSGAPGGGSGDRLLGVPDHRDRRFRLLRVPGPGRLLFAVSTL
jgi:magnesium transporter